jgi:predicted metal-dependent phosphoesterase TrpH
VKLDTHVQSVFSGRSSIGPLRRLMRESYNMPERMYQRATARGMDLVTITDHDTVHFVAEARFNRTLLKDVTSHPMLRVPELA